MVCPGDVATLMFQEFTPPDAISVEEAVRNILDGVGKKELMIVFPDCVKVAVENFKDPVFRDLAQKEVEKMNHSILESQ